MPGKRLRLFYYLLLLLLAACTLEPETAVTPTSPPAKTTTAPTATAQPTATAVPAATAKQGTSTPMAFPPTAITPPTAVPTIVPSLTPIMPADPLVISPKNVGHLTQLAQFGNGRIDSIAWSPDGANFVVGSSRAIDFYDSQTLEKTRSILLPDINGIATNNIRFSPTGEWLILTMGGFEVDSVTLWDVASGQFIRDVYDAAYTDFTADGQLIYYDWDMGQLVWQEPVSGHTTQTLALTYQPWAYNLTSQTAAERYLDTAVRLYDIPSGQLRHTIPVEEQIDSVAFSPQGDVLAVGSRDGFTRLWNVSSGTLLHTLAAQVDSFRGIVFSPDGRFLATSGNDKIVRVWDISTGQEQYQLTGLLPLMYSGSLLTTFSPDGRELAVAGGSSVHFFDTTDGQLRTFNGYSFARSAAFTPDSRTLITVNGQDIQTIDVITGQHINTQASEQPVFTVAFSPINNLMAWGGGNETQWLQLWDTTTNQLLYTVEDNQAEAISKVLFSPDGRLLAVQSGLDWKEPMVRLYEALSGNLLMSWAANRIAFSDDGRFIGITLTTYQPQKSTTEIWDAQTLQLLHELDGLALLAFHPEGTILASSGSGSFEGIWAMESGNLVRQFGGNYSLFTVSSLSPDGRLLLGMSDFGNVFIGDMNTGQQVWSGEPWGNGTFSPDGRYLATVSLDGIVRLWGVPPTTP